MNPDLIMRASDSCPSNIPNTMTDQGRHNFEDISFKPEMTEQSRSIFEEISFKPEILDDWPEWVFFMLIAQVFTVVALSLTSCLFYSYRRFRDRNKKICKKVCESSDDDEPVLKDILRIALL